MSGCLGFDGKMYYNTGTNALATWVEITNARDVSTTASADAAETSDRGSQFKNYCQGMIDLETTTTLTYHNGDTVIEYLRDKFLNREFVQIAVLDGDVETSGTEGFVYFAHVTSNDFDQAMSEGMTVSITFKPAFVKESGVAIPPRWEVIS